MPEYPFMCYNEEVLAVVLNQDKIFCHGTGVIFMKKILVILCIFSLALSGCSIPFFNREDPGKIPAQTESAGFPFTYTETIGVKDVKTALIDAGLQVTEGGVADTDDYVLNNLHPTVYTLKPLQYVLFVYEFDSLAQRIEAGWHSGSEHIITDEIPLPENWLARACTARNILIIYKFNLEKLVNAGGSPQEEDEFKNNLNALNQALFRLNQGQEMVFADRGKLWDARLTVKYFQHWYKDDTDTSHVEQNSKGTWQVKYLGSKPDSCKSIRYEYITFSGSGSGDGHLQKVGEDYYLRLGTVFNTGIPGKDTVYTLRIKCNDQEESLDLKAIKP